MRWAGVFPGFDINVTRPAEDAQAHEFAQGHATHAYPSLESLLDPCFLGATINVQTIGKIGETGVDTFASLNVRHEKGISQLFCGLELDGKGDAFLAGTNGSVTIHENWWNPSCATVRYVWGTDGRVVRAVCRRRTQL